MLAETEQSLELAVLCQQSRLLLFQRVDILGRLLENGRLAQLLALVMRQQRAEALEPGIDALHAAPLVGVGDLPPDLPFLVDGLLATEINRREAMQL